MNAERQTSSRRRWLGVAGGGIALVVLAFFVLSSLKPHRSEPPPSPRSAVKTKARPIIPAPPAPDFAAMADDFVRQPPSDADFAARTAGIRNRGELFRQLGRRDFQLALRLAATGDDAWLTIGRAFYGSAETDPYASLTWGLRNLELAQKSPAKTAYNNFIQLWGAAAFTHARDQLFQFVAEINDPRLRQDALRGIHFSPVMTRDYQAIFDEPRALDLMEDIWLTDLAHQWTRRDQELVLRYAATAEHPRAKMALFIAALEPYFQIGPEEAMSWAISVDPDEKLRVVDSAIRRWTYGSNDPQAVLRWLETKGPNYVELYGENAKRHVAAAMGHQDFVRALDLALTLKDATVQAEVVRGIASAWKENPGALFFNHVKETGHPLVLRMAAEEYIYDQPSRAIELLPFFPAAVQAELRQRLLDHWQKKDSNRYHSLRLQLGDDGSGK